MSLNKDDLIRNRTAQSYYNIDDFVRIREFLVEIGTPINSTILSWNDLSVPSASQFDDFLADIETLRSEKNILTGTPSVPTRHYFNYASANAIEQIIYDVYLLIESEEKAKPYVGTIYSGEVITL